MSLQKNVYKDISRFKADVSEAKTRKWLVYGIIGIVVYFAVKK